MRELYHSHTYLRDKERESAIYGYYDMSFSVEAPLFLPFLSIDALCTSKQYHSRMKSMTSRTETKSPIASSKRRGFSSTRSRVASPSPTYKPS